MRGNGIEHTVSAGGSGALTLAAVTGKPTYASVFGTGGARLVEYTILDGNAMEGGVGSVNLATLVLTRMKPTWTWDGTTYSDHPAAALTVSAGATVICAPMANSFGALTATAMGYYASPFGTYSGSGTITLSANQIHYWPVLMPAAKSLTGFQIGVTTAVASTSIRIGVYEWGLTGWPGALLFEPSGTGYPFDSATTGAKTVTPGAGMTSELFLPPGLYWFAMLSNGAPAVQAAEATPMYFVGTNNNRGFRFFTKGQSSFALPSSGDTTTSSLLNSSGGTTHPWIGFTL